ncbi:MAG: heavy metal resistance protein CzcC [Betaproteobacteria bacterium RIFCSPLOWO2_02_FULL_67_26]|nr:MAG: heavy metal resistance protein CzcC [Betaproteobacteria bacterium RIFCSPLOWO2_02_FULL_67_26]
MKLVIAVVAALLPPIASSHAATLTLAEAQRLAAERSRQLVAQDSAVSASREMAVAAGQLPDPALKLGINNLPVDGPDRYSITSDFMTMRQIGVMQEFTRGEKRQLRTERFEREAERTLAEKSATLATIQRDTALAWLDRYYAEAMAAVVSEQIKEARLEIEAAESAYRGGRGSQADVFAARSAVTMLEDRASEFGRRIRTARTALGRWVGVTAEAPLAGKPDTDTIRLDPRALDTQLAHHPQIAALARQSEIAATEARLAQANKKPDWSVEMMYSQRGSAFSNMVSVNVAIPLQWDQKNRQDRELAAKLAMADQAEAQREEALRAHIGEVRAQIQEWENGRERRARYERELVPLARARTQAALAAYRGGKANLADVLAARRNEIEARMQALQLEAETARLWAQVNFLLPVDISARRARDAENGATNFAREIR